MLVIAHSAPRRGTHFTLHPASGVQRFMNPTNGLTGSHSPRPFIDVRPARTRRRLIPARIATARHAPDLIARQHRHVGQAVGVVSVFHLVTSVSLPVNSAPNRSSPYPSRCPSTSDTGRSTTGNRDARTVRGRPATVRFRCSRGMVSSRSCRHPAQHTRDQIHRVVDFRFAAEQPRIEYVDLPASRDRRVPLLVVL